MSNSRVSHGGGQQRIPRSPCGTESSARHTKRRRLHLLLGAMSPSAVRCFFDLRTVDATLSTRVILWSKNGRGFGRRGRAMALIPSENDRRCHGVVIRFQARGFVHDQHEQQLICEFVNRNGCIFASFRNEVSGCQVAAFVDAKLFARVTLKTNSFCRLRSSDAFTRVRCASVAYLQRHNDFVQQKQNPRVALVIANRLSLTANRN